MVFLLYKTTVIRETAINPSNTKIKVNSGILLGVGCGLVVGFTVCMGPICVVGCVVGLAVGVSVGVAVTIGVGDGVGLAVGVGATVGG